MSLQMAHLIIMSAKNKMDELIKIEWRWIDEVKTDIGKEKNLIVWLGDESQGKYYAIKTGVELEQEDLSLLASGINALLAQKYKK